MMAITKIVAKINKRFLRFIGASLIKSIEEIYIVFKCVNDQIIRISAGNFGFSRFN